MKQVKVSRQLPGGATPRAVAKGEPTLLTSEAGVMLRVPGCAEEGPGDWSVWLPGPVLREATADWMGMASISMRARVALVERTGVVTAFDDLPPERQRSFERLIRGWHDVAAAGGDMSGASESLARWLEAADEGEEAEVQRVNVLRRKLGLPDV